MNAMGRDALRLLGGVAHFTGWVLGTIWLGALVMGRLVRLLTRWRWLVVERRFCPRGHRVPMYGLYECPCGAYHEGWVFGRCDICGESCGWTPCPSCGLPIRNPLL